MREFLVTSVMVVPALIGSLLGVAVAQQYGTPTERYLEQQQRQTEQRQQRYDWQQQQRQLQDVQRQQQQLNDWQRQQQCPPRYDPLHPAANPILRPSGC